MFNRTARLFAIGGLCAGLLVLGARGSVSAQGDGVSFSPECGCNRKPPAVVVGNWAGTIDGGSGTLTLNLSQHNRRLTGTWSASFSEGQQSSGTIAGTVSAKAVNVKLENGEPPLPLPRDCQDQLRRSAGHFGLQPPLSR